jgi:hypothetical protein
MITRAFRASRRDGAVSARRDRDIQRVLTLLAEGELTVSALRDQGVQAPAQAIYTLQLGGYTIDRVPIQHPNGESSGRYRLCGAAEETQADRPFPGGETR